MKVALVGQGHGNDAERRHVTLAGNAFAPASRRARLAGVALGPYEFVGPYEP